MTLHNHDRHVDADEETSLMSRRTILRRSAFGITGIGLATLLTACGDDEGEEDEVIEEEGAVEEEEGEVLEEEGAVEEEPAEGEIEEEEEGL